MINQKRFSPGLIHYWPFEFGSLTDVIGGVTLYNGNNAGFSKDLTYLSMNDGFYQLPTGIYFYGQDFTVMTWVNIKKYTYSQRFLDMKSSNGDVIIMALSTQATGIPYFSIYLFNQSETRFSASKPIPIGILQHITYKVNGNMGYIYVNGILDVSSPINLVSPSTRTSNYLGKSNWGGDGNAFGDFDEIKIFNRPLSDQEILFEMNNFMYNY